MVVMFIQGCICDHTVVIITTATVVMATATVIMTTSACNLSNSDI